MKKNNDSKINLVVYAILAVLLVVGGTSAFIYHAHQKAENEELAEYANNSDYDDSSTDSMEDDDIDDSSDDESESSIKASSQQTAALHSAEAYANNMNMSKAAILDQLTSDAGDKFDQADAQYAVDHVKTDWNKNALKSAESYQKDQDMSTEEIRDQLTSPDGDQFTQEQADYAINHLSK